MTRILFSTVYDPEPLLGRWAATDQMAYRLTRGQGIFTLEEHAHAWPIHLLAQNIEAVSVLLEWPSFEEFEAELASGEYDYVAISFMNRDIDKLAEMSRAVRSLQPKARIVIGGYGVICLSDRKAGDQVIDADFVCRSEGVQFMRQLLGEQVDRPVSCMMPQSGSTLPWIARRSRGTVGAVLAALGCTKRCPFCATSYYTGGKLVEVLGVDALFESMRAYWDINPFTSTVNVYDENFLDYKERVDALGARIRADEKHGLRALNYFTFGSLSAVSKYDPDELLLNGLDTVWIGVESYFSKLKKTRREEQRAPFDLDQHTIDTRNTFQMLHSIGVKTVGSWIIGLSCQNRMNIGEDEDFFVTLRPTFQQISVLTVEPEMPLGRLYRTGGAGGRKFPWRNFHLYGQTYTPTGFTFDEMLDRVDALYRRLFVELGPSLQRMLEANLNGYRYCLASKNPLLRDHKSVYFQRRVLSQAPLLAVVGEYGPSATIRAKAAEMDREIAGLFGAPGANKERYREHLLRAAAREFEARGHGERPIRTDAFRRYAYGPQSAAAVGRKPYTRTHTRVRDYERAPAAAAAVAPVTPPAVTPEAAVVRGHAI
jgi:haloalkane dehalogenase